MDVTPVWDCRLGEGPRSRSKGSSQVGPQIALCTLIGSSVDISVPQSTSEPSLNVDMLNYCDEHLEKNRTLIHWKAGYAEPVIKGRDPNKPTPTLPEAITAGPCHDNMCCLQAIAALPCVHES